MEEEKRRTNALKLCRKAVQKAFICTSCGRVSFLLAGSFHRACIMRNYAVRQLSYEKPRQAKSIPANPSQSRPGEAKPSQTKPDQFQIKIRQTNLSQLTNQSLKTMQTKPRESNASQPSHVNPFKVRRENPTVAPI